MRAIVVHEHGGLNTLSYQERPDPEPSVDEVVVEVHAASVNHLDLWVRRGVLGHQFPLPLITGNDGAGVVRKIGDGVTGVAIGDEVVVAPGIGCGSCPACLAEHDHRCRSYGILGETRDGTHAELVCIPAVNALKKPANLSFIEAAAMPLTFLTAWHMLVDRAELREGETVLVQAAGSGVSAAAIQIAKLWGATIIATSGSDAKLDQARQLGAAHAINYNEADVAREVRRITDGRGVDVVIEHVGEATWEGSMRSLAWHGRLVTCGATTGADVRINLRQLFFKSLSVLGSTMGSRQELSDVLRHAANGALRPIIAKTFPLAEAANAHRLLEERQVFGKLVLIPRSS